MNCELKLKIVQKYENAFYFSSFHLGFYPDHKRSFEYMRVTIYWTIFDGRKNLDKISSVNDNISTFQFRLGCYSLWPVESFLSKLL